MKTRWLYTYFIEFIMSILILIIIAFAFFQFTIYNQYYLTNQLEKNGYYERLDKSIKEEMKNYLIQSGFNESIIENIYSKGQLENAVNNVIGNITRREKIYIHTTSISKKLDDSINNYLINNNIQNTNVGDIETFKEMIINVYKDEILLSDYITKLSNIINKYVPYVYVIFVLVLLIFILIVLDSKKYMRNIFPTSFITSGAILLAIAFFFSQKVDIENLIFIHEALSDIIRSIYNDILIKISITAIILFIISIILIIREIRMNEEY